MSSKNNGGSTDYYKLPKGATDLQDLIEFKNMNFAIGNMFKALYRLGSDGTTSSQGRDLNKIIWFCEREKKRVLSLSKRDLGMVRLHDWANTTVSEGGIIPDELPPECQTVGSDNTLWDRDDTVTTKQWQQCRDTGIIPPFLYLDGNMLRRTPRYLRHPKPPTGKIIKEDGDFNLFNPLTWFITL